MLHVEASSAGMLGRGTANVEMSCTVLTDFTVAKNWKTSSCLDSDDKEEWRVQSNLELLQW
jgi:hypothetical protein